MSKKTIIISAVGALVLLGAGLGGGYYLTTSGTLGADAEAAGPEPEPETLGVIELEPFLTNIGAGGKRHARVSIKLAVSPEERAAEITEDTLAVARLRDLVLTLLTSKSLEDLASPEGKAALRKEIAEKATAVIEPGTVKEALFGEFVVQ
jgi:flagellar FliL protein